MYEKFYNRLTMEATLVAKTGLHIGAGEETFDPTAANGAILRDQKNTPYLPGSSLKGVLRAFFASVDSDDPNDLDSFDLTTKIGRDKLKKEKGWTDDSDGDKKFARFIVENSSDTDILFGSPLIAGKVKLSDAYPTESMKITDSRKGNAINRDTHTTKQGSLFDTEFVQAGTKFRFRLDAENLTKKQAERLILLLDYFADGGIRVGGRSSAGLGEVGFENEIKFTLRRKPENEGFLEKIDEGLTKDNLLEKMEGAYSDV